METKFINEEIKYTGMELAPHWIYKKFHLKGDAIVAFCGECEVKLTEMVDIEDVINDEPIYSKNMLSFIVEHFNIGLVEGVTRQRLLICIIKETIEKEIEEAKSKMQNAKCDLTSVYHLPFIVYRNGDDLFVDGKKLSVSIATKSLTSVLMHVGININPEGAPIDAIGLDFLKICDIKEFANNIMLKYSQEIDDIILASTKVTGR
jgi:uncharacterized protein